VAGTFLRDTGDGMVVAGFLLAPFTKGTSLSLVKAGEYASITGSILNLVVDLSDGESVKEEATDIAITLLSSGAGNMVGKHIDKMPVGKFDSASDKEVAKGMFDFVKKLWSATVDIMVTENSSNDPSRREDPNPEN